MCISVCVCVCVLRGMTHTFKCVGWAWVLKLAKPYKGYREGMTIPHRKPQTADYPTRLNPHGELNGGVLYRSVSHYTPLFIRTG